MCNKYILCTAAKLTALKSQYIYIYIQHLMFNVKTLPLKGYYTLFKAY